MVNVGRLTSPQVHAVLASAAPHALQTAEVKVALASWGTHGAAQPRILRVLVGKAAIIGIPSNETDPTGGGRAKPSQGRLPCASCPEQWPPRLQARQLEQMSSAEFSRAVNSALGSTEAAPTAPLTAALQSWLPGGVAAPFRLPPLVTGFAGGPPRSFPLQLKHSGRCHLHRIPASA